MILDTKERIEKYEKIGVWGKGTILDKLDEVVEECPDREAFVDPPNRKDLTGHNPERITYKELKEKVNAVASGLIKIGIKKDDIVIVQLPNTWELPMLYYAICKAGGIISPMPTQWRRKELEYMLEITGAKVFITIDKFKNFPHIEMGEKAMPNFPSLKQVISLDEIRNMSNQRSEEDFDGIKIVPADVWTLQWSSGTEAEPKACPRTHNSWYYVYAGDVLLQIEKGWKHFTPAQVVNNTGITYSVVLPLITKGTTILHHPFDFEVWISQMEEEKPELAGLVPALMNMVLKHPRSKGNTLSSLKVVGTGSAPPSIWALEEFKSRYGVEVTNIWGMNEGPCIHSGFLTTPIEKRMQFPQFGKKGVDYGINSPHIKAIETKIVDVNTGKEISEVGEVGELVWKGPDMIPCYFNRPELTEKTFDKEEFIHTGDLFKIEESDFISYFDRKKDIIVRGGQNISAQEVENLVLAHPQIADAAAIAMPDKIMGEKVCVFVVPTPGNTITLKDIVNFVKNQDVAVYKLPERIEIIDVIPRNPVGKVLKGELRQILTDKKSQEN